MKWIIIILLIFPCVMAQPESINILNLEYNQGNVEVIEKFSSIGYYPDRIIQEGKYTLKIIGEDILYETKFDPPTIEYLDGDEGGIFTRNKFNFSLIVPSFPNEKEIVIETEGKTEQFSFEQKSSKWWVYLILLIIISFIGFKFLRK